MAKHPRSYPPEFRHQIIELVHSGKTATVVAREFDLNRQTVINWVKQDERDGGRRSDGLTTAEREELAKLRRKVKQLEIERGILSKEYVYTIA